MAGFYDLSDTDNESAIDEIISQAKDACVLEQLSAINCSGVTDSVLPTHLETRFRNLKSFPPNNAKTRSFSTLSSSNRQSPNFSPSKHNPPSESSKFSPSKHNPHSESSNLSPSKHNPETGNPDFSPSKQNPDAEKPSVEKSKNGSVTVSSPLFGSVSVSVSSHSSEESSMSSMFRPTQKDSSKKNCVCLNSPSPPRSRGCLWFSPKKKKERKKSMENWGDELFSELGSFSMKEQQKVLKKAMKEQEKVSREAEKIVQWAKTASARMNLKDEFSDDE